MKLIPTLIVDDEALARTRVRNMLAGEKDIAVTGECSNGPEAIAFIKKNRPHLLFLDVQMPEVSGFDVLRALPPEDLPAVIFVTAHDRHALEAFEVHALDYLLKPFKESRFQEALARAREQLRQHTSAPPNPRLQKWLAGEETATAYPSRLAIKSGERTSFIKVDDVDYIEAAANYAILHVGPVNHILRETLTNLEAKLSPRRFLRINRSAIINLDRVKEVLPAPRGEHLVLLKNGKELALNCGVREIQQRLEFM